MLQISTDSSLKEISEYIKNLREKKGSERETLTTIESALKYGHDLVINLLWEKALTYQHMLMNNSSDKEPLLEMEKVVLEAKYWIEKYKVIRWYSRLYRFLGRISDYKGEYKNSVLLYKKSIKFVDKDPEPFRILELEAFLTFAQIMSDQVKIGYQNAQKLFEGFEKDEKGRKLKRTDYQTWVIWRSGITIRTIRAMLDKKYNFNLGEARDWIAKTEKDLEKGDFSYRKAELKEIESRLQGN